MRPNRDDIAHIRFTSAYIGPGWACASNGDGAVTYTMFPSYVPTDPLLALVHALVWVLHYGGEARCTWSYEPAEDRWTLRRDDDDTLTITLRGAAEGCGHGSRPADDGPLHCTARCDLWSFASTVRLAVSRLEPVSDTTDAHVDPARVRQTPEYRALCTALDEHARKASRLAPQEGSGKPSE